MIYPAALRFPHCECRFITGTRSDEREGKKCQRGEISFEELSRRCIGGLILRAKMFTIVIVLFNGANTPVQSVPRF